MDRRGMAERLGQGRTAEVFAWGDTQVLKLFRPFISRAAAEEELRVSQRVHEAGLPSPAVGDLVEIDGRSGILYERISGPSMLAVIAHRPWSVGVQAASMAELHARIHRVEIPELAPVKVGLDRAIERVEGLLPEDQKVAVLRALAALPKGDAVAHGDFHPDNIILSPRGPVVLDWMTALRGHPLADVARTSLILTEAAVPSGMPGKRLIAAARGYLHRVYLNRYRTLLPFAVQDLEAWLLPVAAARLSENIPEERTALLAMVAELSAPWR